MMALGGYAGEVHRDLVQDLMPGVQSGCLDSCESLRTVWLWDEDYVDPELVESLSGALPDARIYQGFDQAECAFFVTLLQLTGGDDESCALHGQPLPNTRVRLYCCAALMHLHGTPHIMTSCRFRCVTS